MPALTLLAARELLWNSASDKPLNYSQAEKDAVDSSINQAVERLLTMTRPRGTVLQATFTVYDYQITLPRTMENILGWKLLDSDGNSLVGDRNIYNRWFQFNGRTTSDQCQFAIGLYDQGDGFVTFRPLPAAGKIKIYTTTTENANPFCIRGLASGQKVYTGTGPARVEGEVLTLPTGSGSSVTSSTTFDKGDSLYEIVKPFTNGVLTLYHVDPTTAVETLIGQYEPGETIPNYRRYKFPKAKSDNTSSIQIIADEAFCNAKTDRDQLAISNIGALKNALKALAYEDANDMERYSSYLNSALSLLDNERQKFDGDSTIGIFNVIGDYGAAVYNTY